MTPEEFKQSPSGTTIVFPIRGGSVGRSIKDFNLPSHTRLCVSCQNKTGRHYANQHNGLCKKCFIKHSMPLSTTSRTRKPS